ncbi:C4-dicarboxylate TRAP transporter substrate-binding protein [Fredinandcohnia sp. QZ13]|uniref:C4-dicarboxylate TRAP transporter substrate-binding protein n=1 Tax=Fredinandcohnia sp. QZ13 TaxID=3073144 RepID=UPI0028535642|nr:C4-dicarboxylate TRAP transporter substrate-binding protein [Fredinandcohnia sp. QZ13]MDR4890386.1 C4-dicarboxylate TRAP transporter substrate-binding protein [Fredinandcohnia sp. QZ13]
MKKIISLVVLVFITAIVAAGCSSDSSSGKKSDDKVYILKMSTQQAETAPIVEGFKELAKNLEEKSDGRLKMEVYPSAQLGSDDDVIEQAEQGVNVAVLTDGSRMGVYVEEMGIIGAPYFVDNYEDALKVTQGDTFKGWEKQLAEEHGLRVLSFNWYDGPRHFLTNEPIEKPEDLKGLRIRTPGSPVWQESVKALGATPVAMPWGEVYTAVQQGAVDGAEAQHTSTYPSRIYEVIKYVNKTGHFQLINGIIVGEKWFETLPEDLQQLLLDETKAVAQKNAEYVASLQADFEDKMKAEGMEVVEPDVEAFKKAAEKAYEVLGLTELREQIYQEMGK